MLDNWQRIEQIIKWGGFASVSAFAREIGLNRSENLYQIKRGNNGISRELAEIITDKYPQISKAWLLTGEGDMLPADRNRPKPDLPFFKTDAVQLILSEERPKEDEFISLSIFRGCDFAAYSFSDAMEPDILRGTVLVFQRSDVGNLTPGEIYLVISPRFNGIRYVRQAPLSSKLRLIPGNTENYDEVVIEQGEIEELYLVRGIIINRFS